MSMNTKKANTKKAKNKIGILTWHYYSNFGSRLQSYALQNVIGELGYAVNIINYQNPLYSNTTLSKRIKTMVKLCLNKLFSNMSFFKGQFRYSDLMFEKKYLRQTQLITSKDQLLKLTDEYSKIVYGSDQIWAPNVFNDIYMGAGVDVRKISYAASIGLPNIPDELVNTYKRLLNDFDEISVREEATQKLLKEKCGLDSKVVLDPTLLIGVEHYKGIECKPSKCERREGKDFAFCYFLNDNNNYWEKVSIICKEKKLKIYGVSLDKKNFQWMENMAGIGPREFIWLIDKAKYVFTDSYHGTIFSLLFHKDFFTFERFKADDPINQNSRIYQLDKWFNIGNRIVRKNIEDVLDKPYDYSFFEIMLEKYKEQSLSYLREALV